jgi:Fe2+ transport system protein B
MGACGITGLFMPHELLRTIGIAPVGILPVLVQLLAALLFAFAMVNWMARGSLIGGIYNRPVAIGNLTHFGVGALTLAKAVASGARATAVVIFACLYVVFAVAFAMLFFRSPVKEQNLV